MPVTTRIITFSVGNPYKPSFATVTGWGVDPIYIYIEFPLLISGHIPVVMDPENVIIFMSSFVSFREGRSISSPVVGASFPKTLTG